MLNYQWPPVEIAPATGGATEAKQDVQITELQQIEADIEAGNASLSSIDTKLSSQATAAKQDVGNASLSSIDTKLSSQATAAKQDALLAELQLKADLTETQPVSVATLPLPAGAATAANQATANTSLGTIATNTTITKGSGVVDANTTRVTLATDGPLVTAVGAQADAAASSDTGSFSILSFIKRGMQNWTTLLSRLPSSLGQKTAANSLAVVLPSDQTVSTSNTPSSVAGTISSAKIGVGLAAVRATVTGSAPSASRKKLMIKPSKNNTGTIYIGGSGVAASTGLEIIGPDRLEFEFDSGDYYLISDTAAQEVEILEKV